jgi:hypothetical protein
VVGGDAAKYWDSEALERRRALAQGREVRKEGAERRLLGREILSLDAKRLL